MVKFTVVDQLSFERLRSHCARQVPSGYDSTCGDHCCREWQESCCLEGLAWLSSRGAGTVSLASGMSGSGIGSLFVLCVSAVVPVLCVVHLYYIDPVGNLSCTDSWTQSPDLGVLRVPSLQA